LPQRALTSGSRYIRGFLDGQATAYCEQVRLGSRLAGAINCPQEYAEDLRGLVLREQCLAKVTLDGSGRASVWIYRYSFLEHVIDRIERPAGGRELPDAFAIWASGKLFGYSDHEIARYIEATIGEDEDSSDAETARRRLQEIQKNPQSLITGDALKARLERCQN